MIAFAIKLSLILLLHTAHSQIVKEITEVTPVHSQQCTPFHYDHDAISRSAQKARTLLTQDTANAGVAMVDRLAVMILFSHGFHEYSLAWRLKWLRCSLQRLQRNLQSSTPADIFIWTLNSTEMRPRIPRWLKDAEAFPAVHVMDIEPSTWQVPCGLSNDSMWAMRDIYDVNYRLMGRWRLSFSPAFVRAMGYEYYLQIDDDAILRQPMPENILQRARRQQVMMGVFPVQRTEAAQAAVGLPELARYWLAISNYSVAGDLLSHLQPPDPGLSGLTSAGWDRGIFSGYFNLISLEYWFDDAVQDFLNTVFRSGRDIEGRWQEQAVMNMMRLLFIPLHRMWFMVEADVAHGRRRPMNFKLWCEDVPVRHEILDVEIMWIVV